MEFSGSVKTELASISASDWAMTPVSVQQLLVRLIERLEEQSEQIALLQAENQEFRQQILALQTENASLKEQLNKNSDNSSQPSSQDNLGFVPKVKGKKGLKRGVNQVISVMSGCYTRWMRVRLLIIIPTNAESVERS